MIVMGQSCLRPSWAFPWYAKMFGGRQAALLHLISMFTYLGFAHCHVGLVFIVHAPHNLTHIVFGCRPQPLLWVRPTPP